MRFNEKYRSGSVKPIRSMLTLLNMLEVSPQHHFMLAYDSNVEALDIFRTPKSLMLPTGRSMPRPPR